MPRILNSFWGRFLALLVLCSLSIVLSSCSQPQKEETAVEAAAPEGSSLYSRIGGQPVLRNFANEFVKQIALNNKIMSNPLIAGALSKNQDAHKKKLATLLCQISGGPCKYDAGPKGQAIKEAHAPLKITQEEWKEMTRVFIQVLQRMKVKKRERQDLARLVVRFKPQIVGP